MAFQMFGNCPKDSIIVQIVSTENKSMAIIDEESVFVLATTIVHFKNDVISLRNVVQNVCNALDDLIRSLYSMDFRKYKSMHHRLRINYFNTFVGQLLLEGPIDP